MDCFSTSWHEGSRVGGKFGVCIRKRSSDVSCRDKGIWCTYSDDIPLMSITGNLLHHDLVNFYVVASQNYENYLTDPAESELDPVFVMLKTGR